MSAAAAKSRSRNNSGNSRQPPDLPLRDRVAAQLQGMAAEAQCAELAEGAADPEIAGDTVYQLMAHQLAAGHALTMSLGAHAGRLVREAKAGATADDDGGRRSQEMLRFVAGTARLMERCRSAALALDRIGFPEVPAHEPDGPGEGQPMGHGTINGFPSRVIASRDKERRRLMHWLEQGKRLADLPKVEDWPEYHDPILPDLEKLDDRLYPPALRSSANNGAGPHAAPGLKRGRLKNGNPVGDYLTAPRCGASTRAGASCRQPAMANGRCRFHGGKSTGPRTAEGLRRSRTARLTHGFRTAEIIDLRSAAARIGRSLRALTSMAHTAPPSSFHNQKEITPLPQGERGQGVRGLARGSALISKSSSSISLTESEVSSRAQSDRSAERLMPRFRAETPHPYASPPRGEGCFSLSDAIGDDKRIGALGPAGHEVHRSVCAMLLDTCPPKPLAKADGVHRPGLPRPPSTAGHRHQQKRRRRA